MRNYPNLAWTDNSNNELGFKVYRSQNGGSYSQVATTTMNAVSYSDTGLSADQTYSYYVQAYNSNGGNNSNASTAITYNTAPTAPSSLSVSASGADNVLSWSDNSNNEDGFKIERSTDNVSFTQIATTTLNLSGAASHTDTGSSGTTYLSGEAYNTIGNSAYSNTVSHIVKDVVTVSGHITSDAAWTSDHIYVVTSAVTVDQYVKLTIQEGTEVRFASGVGLIISTNGVLVAEGSPSNTTVL